jgi:hypothetical protein
MKKVNGITLTGWHCHDTNAEGLSTCGLAELSFKGYTESKTEPQHAALREELATVGTNWGGKNNGNFVFSVTSQQIIEANTNDTFRGWLLNHPNTQVMHYYKNNAHGPNIIFLCVHHMYPDKVEPKTPVFEEYTIASIRKRLHFDDVYQYALKEPE